jgi:hypothetical protein
MGIGANSYNSAAQDSAKQTVIVVDCRGGAALWVAATGQGGTALLVGLLAGPVLLGVLLASVWATWGDQPTPIRMRQPWFRVLGDNPAAITWVTKVRVREEPVVVGLDRCAEGPVSAVLYRIGLGPVASVSWEDLKEAYEGGRAQAVLCVPPGRYLLSVRCYRPFATSIEPRVAC